MNERAEAIEAVCSLPPESKTLLIGGTDTGKTTFAVEAINKLMLRDQFSICVVDSDIGQSEIGPPGVVGVGVLRRESKPLPLKSLTNIPQIAGVFVGATSPGSNALQWTAATVEATDITRFMHPRPHHTIIDTPGFVSGIGATALKSLIAIVQPSLILAFARGSELEPILRPLSMLSVPNLTLLGVPIAPQATRKTSDTRTLRRTARFAERFQGASSILLQWDQVAFENTALTYGEAQLPHLLRFIGMTLGGTCSYAEKQPDGTLLTVIEDSPPPTKINNTGIIEQNFKVNRVVICPASRFHDLLCGLHNDKGELLDVGLIRYFDFERRRLEILTKVKHPGSVSIIKLGYLRLKPDGREIKQLHPSEAP